MADVAGGSVGDAGRGQLILVTALSMAILFVALALILNTAIYTENLATRSSDIGGGTDAVRYHDAARDGVGGMVEYVNAHNNTTHDALARNLSTGVEAFTNHSGRQFAAGDRAVETTINTTNNGTRIAQNDADRNFTNTSFAADWTLATGVDNTRAVEINVSNDAPLAGAGSGNEFELILDGSNDWVLNVTTGGTVGITNGDGETFTCTESSEPVINVSGGTVDGNPCPGLELAEGVDSSYDIRIVNGDAINGTYTMLVDDEGLADSPAPHLVDDGAGQPFVVHAVYSVTIDVVYETPRLYYETTFEVVPEAADD